MHRNFVGIPRCPNHGEPLMIDNLNAKKGACPVSGVIFAFEAEEERLVRDHQGNVSVQKVFRVTGED